MKKFAVFDIDGTLIRWQLYHAVVDKLLNNGVVSSKNSSQLREARMNWKKRKSENEFKTYEKLLIKIFEDSLPEISVQDFDKSVNEVFQQYSDQVYTYTRDLIDELKNRDYFLIAISGSHEELVQKIAARFGFDEYIGTKYQRKSNKFTGDKTIGSHDKQAKLREIINKHQLTYKESFAIGDSLSDSGMLEIVENPIAFNPNKELLKTARSAGWKIVIERKNVVYELNRKGDNYVLA